MRADHDQALDLELPQRLAHGDAADAELLRDRLLAHRLPGLQPALVDRVAQPARDVLGAGLVGAFARLRWIRSSVLSAQILRRTHEVDPTRSNGTGAEAGGPGPMGDMIGSYNG